MGLFGGRLRAVKIKAGVAGGTGENYNSGVNEGESNYTIIFYGDCQHDLCV